MRVFSSREAVWVAGTNGSPCHRHQRSKKGKKYIKNQFKKMNASSWPPHKPLNIDKSFLTD
jgi:hypothetical protein